jgi:hypothetical protein
MVTITVTIHGPRVAILAKVIIIVVTMFGKLLCFESGCHHLFG